MRNQNTNEVIISRQAAKIRKEAKVNGTLRLLSDFA